MINFGFKVSALAITSRCRWPPENWCGKRSIQEALLLSDRIVVMSARPGRVAEIIDVPLPRPRGLDTLADPRFTALANDIRAKVFTRKPEVVA